MPQFTGFNLKARPGETVSVYTAKDAAKNRQSLADNDPELSNAIEMLLKKCDQVAVISRDADRGGGVIGFRAVKRKR